MFHVYVIRSEQDHWYVGSTSNLEQRILDHNIGRSFWTRRGTGWRVVYQEEYPTKAEAMKRERWLKSGVGREFIRKNAAW